MQKKLKNIPKKYQLIDSIFIGDNETFQIKPYEHKGDLYIINKKGLWKITKTNEKKEYIMDIPFHNNQGLGGMLVHKNKLYAFIHKNIYKIDLKTNQFEVIEHEFPVASIYHKVINGKIYGTTYADGIFIFDPIKNQLTIHQNKLKSLYSAVPKIFVYKKRIFAISLDYLVEIKNNVIINKWQINVLPKFTTQRGNLLILADNNNYFVIDLDFLVPKQVLYEYVTNNIQDIYGNHIITDSSTFEKYSEINIFSQKKTDFHGKKFQYSPMGLLILKEKGLFLGDQNLFPDLYNKNFKIFTTKSYGVIYMNNSWFIYSSY